MNASAGRLLRGAVAVPFKKYIIKRLHNRVEIVGIVAIAVAVIGPVTPPDAAGNGGAEAAAVPLPIAVQLVPSAPGPFPPDRDFGWLRYDPIRRKLCQKGGRYLRPGQHQPQRGG